MHQGRWLKLALTLALIPGAGLASPEFPAPQPSEGGLLLQNTANLASYSPAHKQASWVFYSLSDSELRNCHNRGGNFRSDSRLPSGSSAQLSDFSGSGLDRGHLSPAGDNKWSGAAMSESFLLSNISPQPAHFNRGIWSRLENLVRAWAHNFGGLWVATGPLLRSGLGSIGRNKVSVPEYFYKVLATKSSARQSAIAFLLPTNAGSNLPKYALSVRELEEISGLDFLSGIENERELENSIDPKAWNFQAQFTYLPCQAVAPGVFDWAWGLSLPL